MHQVYHSWWPISSLTQEYVIFPNRVFSYVIGDLKTKIMAQDFARSIEVPESQLGWLSRFGLRVLKYDIEVDML